MQEWYPRSHNKAKKKANRNDETAPYFPFSTAHIHRPAPSSRPLRRNTLSTPLSRTHALLAFGKTNASSSPLPLIFLCVCACGLASPSPTVSLPLNELELCRFPCHASPPPPPAVEFGVPGLDVPARRPGAWRADCAVPGPAVAIEDVETFL